MANRTKKTVKGSCHCGFITFTANVQIDEEGSIKANRCNCTFCQKLGTTNMHLDGGRSDFQLLSPASTGEIGQYAPRMKTLVRYFCRTCGSHVWMEGYFLVNGHRQDIFSVNLATVDQPQEGVDLSLAKISYFDALNDNFEAGASDKPWPNGLV
ncbi:hypothetical protein LTR37_010726 [Vermiconidia calcicola]|uniref:Uncharacterized protein n=1 Tax=Vermiconidia calcicola TaxID=1690605 RepID=A0ACC3N456_9PEZI|nr:hypothetical protein LTR37_010726 [Vermiconidia calcicola]